MDKFNRRYIVMIGAHMNTMNHRSSRCSHSAEACTCARISAIMDTAYVLVVSILVAILSLRLWMLG